MTRCCNRPLALALFWLGVARALVVPSTRTASVLRNTATRLRVGTALEPTTVNGDATAKPMGWECNEDAECVEVPLCDENECRTSLDVRIHGDWYDLSGE